MRAILVTVIVANVLLLARIATDDREHRRSDAPYSYVVLTGSAAAIAICSRMREEH